MKTTRNPQAEKIANQLKEWNSKPELKTQYEKYLDGFNDIQIVEYKGYSIKVDPEHTDYRKPYDMMFYKTEEGVQHDGDFDGEDWKYCGNCKWADDLQEAKLQIDELTDN